MDYRYQNKPVEALDQLRGLEHKDSEAQERVVRMALRAVAELLSCLRPEMSRELREGLGHIVGEGANFLGNPGKYTARNVENAYLRVRKHL